MIELVHLLQLGCLWLDDNCFDRYSVVIFSDSQLYLYSMEVNGNM